MNILFVTPYITSNLFDKFLINKTGFGYMVNDIANAIGVENSVELFQVSTFSNEMRLGNYNVIGRKWTDLLIGLDIKLFFEALRFISKYRTSLISSFRTLYYFLSVGTLSKKIQKYDVVHIHGCSPLTYATIALCNRKKVPFLVTLHGLVSFEKTVKLETGLKNYERDYLEEAAAECYLTSFISTGIKKTAEAYVGRKVDTFVVLPNGCDTVVKQSVFSVREAYNIQNDDFVFLCVGNITDNKNQFQVVKAFGLLPESIRKKVKILLIGRECDGGRVSQEIMDQSIGTSILQIGWVSKENLPDYYTSSDATILASKAEGFGLSIIEGYVYGKPNVTFSDLPATQDLFDPNTMILADQRSDYALAEAMIKAVTHNWDSSKIMSFSKRFSLENMAKEYINVYNNIV